MIERILLGNPWLAVALGVLVFAVDYYTAIYQTYFYQAGMQAFVEYQDLYKLTAEVDGVVTRRRSISGRLAAIVSVLAASILGLWWLCLRQFDRPDVFLFLIGGFVLDEAAEIIRQYRQIMVFREVQKQGGLTGKIELYAAAHPHADRL